MNSKTAAIAILVKTPGLSPLKTRLAATIGSSAAEEFHLRSAAAIESVLNQVRRRVNDFTPVWCIAESDGMSFSAWQGFERIQQSKGGLGDRLRDAYGELKEHYDFVFLMGADSPLISSDIFEDALTTLQSNKASFVLGLCRDGGYYLFGGERQLPDNLWTSIEYSSSQTGEQFNSLLSDIGEVSMLPALSDVDTIEDLNLLVEQSRERKNLTLEQSQLISFARILLQS